MATTTTTESLVGDAMMENSTGASPIEATTAIITTTISTTTTSFYDSPGTLADFHDMCVADWDEVYDGHTLAPRGYTSWNALNIGRVSLCIWIILTHFFLIVFVLGKRALRINPKNPLIANLAVANILMGVFVVPVKQHFILNPHTVHCGLEVGWTFIADYFQPAVSLFAVLSLVFERFVYVYAAKNHKKILRTALILITIGLLIMPWLMSILFLVPTYLVGFNTQSTEPNTCLFKVEQNYFLAAQILSFILPSLGVVILAPYTGLLDCLRPSHCVYESLTPKGESMTVTALISFVSIFSEAPYCVVRVLMMEMECDNPYCTRLLQALNVAMWIRIGKAAVFPFIWLFYTDIRKAILCHLPKSRHDADYYDDVNVDNGDETAMLGMEGNSGVPKDESKPKEKLYPIASTSATALAD